MAGNFEQNPGKLDEILRFLCIAFVLARALECTIRETLQHGHHSSVTYLRYTHIVMDLAVSL